MVMVFPGQKDWRRLCIFSLYSVLSDRTILVPADPPPDHCDMKSVLQECVRLLSQHDPYQNHPGPPGEWLTLVRVLLDRARVSRKQADWSWLADSPLRTPVDTAGLNAGRLAGVLESAGHAASQAGPLLALAQWWIETIGGDDACAVFQSLPLEHWQKQLRALRGVSWELADRILLFVGGREVYPLDRGSLRVAARHGWMDLEAEYDDWQAFFGSGLREATVDFGETALALARVGREFCKSRPNCEDCPLKSLLPARGPVPLDSEE